MKKKHNKLISIALVVFLCLQIIVPASAEGSENTVNIYTTEDFIEFADNCSLDTWSAEKTVVLQADISLRDTGFRSIATFGGIFDGNGYTISEMNLTEAMSPSALFAVIQSGAVVKNLNVEGEVAPSGDASYAGGIAGENYGTILNCTYTGNVSGAMYTGGICGLNTLSGKIENCQMAGVVSGDKMTGGVAGYNMGIISSCQNESYVNTSNTGSSVKITEVNLELSMDLNDLDSEGVSTTATDTGGISGQMEPYVVMTLSEDSLSKLKKQSEDLNTQINQMLNDMNSSVGTVTNRLNNIAGYLDSVADAADNVSLQGSINSSASGNINAGSEGEITVTNPEIESDDGNLSISSGIEGENGVQAEGQ